MKIYVLSRAFVLGFVLCVGLNAPSGFAMFATRSTARCTTPPSSSSQKRAKVESSSSMKRAPVSTAACGHSVQIVDESAFQRLKVLGEGQFSRVDSGTYKGAEIVLKVLKKQVSLSSAQKEFERQKRAGEAGVAPKVNTELGVFCYQEHLVSFDPNPSSRVTFAFAMEPIPHAMSLLHYAQTHSMGTILDQIADFTLDAFDGLHNLSIVHRDVAPENILVVGNNAAFDRITAVQLIDFGLVDEDDDAVGHHEYLSKNSLQLPPVDRDRIAMTRVLLHIANRSRQVGIPTGPELLAQVRGAQEFSESMRDRLAARILKIFRIQDSRGEWFRAPSPLEDSLSLDENDRAEVLESLAASGSGALDTWGQSDTTTVSELPFVDLSFEDDSCSVEGQSLRSNTLDYSSADEL